MDTGGADDLTKIKGIGPKTARAMNELGINTFEDLANGLSNEQRRRVDAAVDAPVDLDYPDFIAQAMGLTDAGGKVDQAVETPTDAAADKEAADKVAADKAEADKIAADKAAAEKVAADEAAAEKELAEKAAADAKLQEHETIVGSDDLPAMVAIPHGGEVPLGDVVMRAHEMSGLTSDDYNDLPGKILENMLDLAVIKMGEEARLKGPAHWPWRQ